MSIPSSAARVGCRSARASAPARVLGQLANRLNRKRRVFAEVEDVLIHGPDKPVVLCLSDYVKEMILRHYPDITGQLVKLFNGTDLKLFDPAATGAVYR